MNGADGAIHGLVREGAAIVFAKDPNQNAIGVAWWRRVRRGRHFWHAPGVSGFDHHILDAAKEVVHYDGYAVEFQDREGEIVAYLTHIHELQTDPVAAERIAGQIRAWKAEFDANQHLRAAVLDAYRRARESR